MKKLITIAALGATLTSVLCSSPAKATAEFSKTSNSTGHFLFGL